MGQTLSCQSCGNEEEDVKLIRELHAILEPLSGVCTYNLLHHARVHRYGEDYAQIISEDREELLLSLGRVGHVPNNTPMTTEFEGHVRAFVNRLVEAYFKHVNNKLRLICCLGEFNNDYVLRPIGSFPCDTKVGDIDEFDYLCVLDLPANWMKIGPVGDECVIKSRAYHCRKAALKLFNTERLVLFYRQIMENYDKKQKRLDLITTAPRVDKIYTHGPAACFTCNWYCTDGHSHSLSTDLSFAISTKYEELKEFCELYVSELPESLLCLQDLHNCQTCVVRPKEEWCLSSCTLDLPIMDLIERNIAPNIRLFYRCLKLLMAFILPIEVSSRNYYSDLFYNTHRIESSTISSHALKCLVLNEIKLHPGQDDWEKENIFDRLINICRCFSDNGKDDDWPANTEDVISGVSTGKTWHSRVTHELCSHPSIARSLDALCHQISAGQILKMHEQETCMNDKDECKIYMKRYSGNFVKLKMNSAETNAILDDSHIYKLKCSRYQPYEEHYLIRWCKHHVFELCHENVDIDISQSSKEEYPWILALTFAGCISTLDLSNQETIDNILHLKQRYVRYGDGYGGFWHSIMIGVRNQDQVPPGILEYITHARDEDLETILESEMYKLDKLTSYCLRFSGLNCCLDIEMLRENTILEELQFGEHGRIFKTWCQEERSEVDVDKRRTGTAVIYHCVRTLLKRTSIKASKIFKSNTI